MQLNALNYVRNSGYAVCSTHPHRWVSLQEGGISAAIAIVASSRSIMAWLRRY